MKEKCLLRIEMYMENIETYTRLRMKRHAETEFNNLWFYVKALNDAEVITFYKFLDCIKEAKNILKGDKEDENNEIEKSGNVGGLLKATI